MTQINDKYTYQDGLTEPEIGTIIPFNFFGTIVELKKIIFDHGNQIKNYDFLICSSRIWWPKSMSTMSIRSGYKWENGQTCSPGTFNVGCPIARWKPIGIEKGQSPE